MYLLSVVLVSVTLVARTLSQTPPGTSPATNEPLSVYYGTTKVTPGIELPLAKVVSPPTFNYPSSSDQTYQLLFVDLSIPEAIVNTSALVPGYQTPLAPGIASGRTTRLHYWQTGVTFTTNGTLVKSTSPIAYYQPPMPPPGDIAHAYAFYIFKSDASFSPPPVGSPFSQTLVNQGMNRFSFNVNNFAAEKGIGRLVGATYLLAQNKSGSASASASGSGTGSVSTPTAAPFLGGSSRYSLGLTGGVVVLTAIVFASLLAA